MRKSKLSLRIDGNKILLAIVLFTLFRFCSPVFINGTAFAPIYTLISKIVAAAIFGWYFLVHRKASVPFLMVLLFFTIRLFTTLWHTPQNVTRVLMGAYPILALVCLSDIFMKKNAKLFARSFAWCLKILCTVNALQSLFLPDLFYQKYIIGGENQIVFTYILSAVLEKAICAENSQRLKWYLLLLTVSIIRIFSAGNLLGWLVFLAIFYFYRKPREVKAISVFWGYCFSWLLIVVVRIQNIFAWLIVGILHKNLTLTNRTVIWDSAFNSIKEKPLLGYGVQNTVNLFYTYIERRGKPTVDKWFSAHNQVVQTLYESGIISLIPIVLLAVVAFHRLDKYRNERMYSVLVAGIIGVSVSLMAEAPGWDALFVLLTLAYYVKILSSVNYCEGK